MMTASINEMNTIIYRTNKTIEFNSAILNKICIILTRISVQPPNYLYNSAIRNFLKRLSSALTDFIRLRSYIVIKIKSSICMYSGVRGNAIANNGNNWTYKTC